MLRLPAHTPYPLFCILLRIRFPITLVVANRALPTVDLWQLLDQHQASAFELPTALSIPAPSTASLCDQSVHERLSDCRFLAIVPGPTTVFVDLCIRVPTASMLSCLSSLCPLSY